MEKYLVIFFVFFIVLYDSINPISANSSGHGFSANIDGDYILDLGNQYNFSELQLIGRVYKNFEHNMSMALKEARIEFLLSQVCKWKTCDQWSTWTPCSADKGFFGIQTKSRTCGRNTTMCVYGADKQRIETRSEVCLSKHSRPMINASTSPKSERFTTEETPMDQTTDLPTTAAYHINCPSHYTAVHGYCLQLVTAFTYSHTLSKMLCQWDGGSLLKVDSVNKRDALYSYLQGFSGRVWIDGSRASYGGFVDTFGDPIQFDNWLVDEPADFVLDTEGIGTTIAACLADGVGSVSRGWEALHCDNNLNFVCEHPVLP